MKKAALILICLILLISSVSAALINTTIVTPTNYNGEVSSSGLLDTYSYVFEPGTNNAIVFQEIVLSRPGFIQNTPIIFKLYLADTTTITGKINTTTGYLSGKVVSSFDSGTTSTSGSNFYNIRSLIYPVNLVYLYANSTGIYYLALVESTRVNYAPFAITGKNLGSLDLDTTADAYIAITGKPSDNPIVKCDYSAAYPFTILTYYEQKSALAAHENTAAIIGDTGALPADRDWVGKLLELIGLVLNAAYTIIVVAATLAVYMVTGFAFLLLAQVFLTLVAAYTIIALVMSFYDSDDLFKSIGSFIKREMKLFRFFMDIFKWIKTILKWW